MRKYIDAVQMLCEAETMSEGRVYPVTVVIEDPIHPDEQREVLVVENPSPVQVRNFLAKWHGRARFTISDGRFFMWNAHQAIHDDMGKALGIGGGPTGNYLCAGFVYEPGVLALRYGVEGTAHLAPVIQALPSVQYAFGPNVPVESTDDDW